MADQKLSELTELAAAPATDDEIYIRDVSEAAASESKRITIANLKTTIIEHHTASDTLTKYETGSMHTNLGAGAAILLKLPQDALAGTRFEFAIMNDQQLRIDPGAAGSIYINGAKQADDAYIVADDEAESVILTADGNGDWIASSVVGTWTVV